MKYSKINFFSSITWLILLLLQHLLPVALESNWWLNWGCRGVGWCSLGLSAVENLSGWLLSQSYSINMQSLVGRLPWESLFQMSKHLKKESTWHLKAFSFSCPLWRNQKPLTVKSVSCFESSCFELITLMVINVSSVWKTFLGVAFYSVWYFGSAWFFPSSYSQLFFSILIFTVFLLEKYQQFWWGSPMYPLIMSNQ